MRTYLKQIAAGPITPGGIHAVLGNESCDVDSALSSVALAYWLHATTGEHTVPFLHIEEHHRRLKADVQLVLDQLCPGIAVPSLHHLRQIAPTRVTLTDHNRFNPRIPLAPQIVQIVDHHADEHAHPNANRDIQMVASTCTLIAERFLSTPTLLCPALARTLAATIVLDSRNFNPNVATISPKDHATYQALLPFAEASPQDILDFTAKITAVHQDLANYSSKDILMKDYKQWSPTPSLHLGIASTTLPLEEWITTKDNLPVAAAAYMQEHHLDILITMTASKHPQLGFRRQIWCLTAPSYPHNMEPAFSHPTFHLVPLACPPMTIPNGYTSYGPYNNLELNATRKKVAPALVEYLSKAK